MWLSISDLSHGQVVGDSVEYVSNEALSIMKIVPEGTLMVSFKLTLGRTSVAARDLYTNEAIAAILNLDPSVNQRFLMHFFDRFDWKKACEGDEKLKGYTFNKAKLNVLEIPIPPLEEQERIVEVLDEAFAAIDKAKANIERNLTNARELFQSRLNDIFSNPSEDWEVKPLGEVCDFQNGFAFKSKWYSDSGTRVIRIGDIQDDSVEIQEARCVQESSIDDDFSRYVIPNGAILIAMSGATTGKIGVFEHRTRALLNQRVGCIEPLPEIKQRFLWNFMKFYSVGYLAISAGSAQPNLSTKQICSTPIPIPAFEEQDRICGKLDELAEMTEALETGYQTELDNLEELRQSILEQAFEGKLTEPVTA